MHIQLEKSQESKDRTIAQYVVQKKSINQGVSFVDNRPDAIIRKGALNTYSKTPIQRFIGAKGTLQERGKVPFTLNEDEFVKKHVAENVSDAIAKTQDRIDNDTGPGGNMIRQKKGGNTVATKATWENAIDENTDVIPETFAGPDESDKEKDDFDPSLYNDSGYTKKSSYMHIAGWDIKKGEGESLDVVQKTMNRRVAGNYTIDDLNVSVDINHCTQ